MGAALLTAGLVAAAEATTDAPGAVRRGLAFVEKEGAWWKDERKCASCHHAPMMVWTLGEAKARGYAVNEEALKAVADWSLAPGDPGKVVPAPLPAPPFFAMGAMTMAAGLGAVTPAESARPGLAKLLDLLVTEQAEDGTWSQKAAGRPPMLGDPEILTLWTLLALKPEGWEDPAGSSWEAARAKGLAWLRDHPTAGDLRALALRLVVRKRLDPTAEGGGELTRRLLALQKPDGGWSQTPELASDAYATGLALYALAAAGEGPPRAAMEKGRAYLVRTQRPDGGWTVESRKGVPGMMDGKDSGPISYVGSAWATLGLLRSLPPAR
jgi:hypothetical protein